MNHNSSLKVCFMGSNQAGIIGALTVLAKGFDITAAVSYSDDLSGVLRFLDIPIYMRIIENSFVDKLKDSDLLLSVHGKEIVAPALLRLPRLGAINVHPYLYKYKGAYPVERALRDKEFRASVGVHFMTDKIDEGGVIAEEFIDVSGSKSAEEVYNKLYPYYSLAVLKALDIILQDGDKYANR